MTHPKAVRFAAVLVVLAGYVLVFRSGEGRIGARLAQNAELADRLDAGRRLVANRTALERERTRLNAVLRIAGTLERPGAPVPAFLHHAASVAAAQRTTVTTVTAGGAPPRPTASNATTPSAATIPSATTTASPLATAAGETSPSDAAGSATSAFETTAFDVVVEGRYTDVLATVRELSASSRVLASVEVASLARKSAGTDDSTLSASLRITLHRLTAPAKGRSS
ncbi:MAG TPA: hypothetical protein VHS78_03860 [Candidatus Elarobacter sp.]|jgi:hypothetical protein|nr:hypothetical protein [Candidatus Elarobacter sp.]